jgi:hypothetical protein
MCMLHKGPVSGTVNPPSTQSYLNEQKRPTLFTQPLFLEWQLTHGN